MPAQAADTVLRCKLCAHEKRTEIDALLELRSKRQKNTKEVLAELEELGVENPTLDNIKGHLGQRGNKAHTVFITEEQQESTQEVREAALEGLKQRIASGEPVNADHVLDTLVHIGMTDLEARLRDGASSGITIDHILKAIGEKTKRKTNEAQDELLKGLGAAAGAMAKKLMPADEQPAIEGEAEEAEFEALPSAEDSDA